MNRGGSYFRSPDKPVLGGCQELGWTDTACAGNNIQPWNLKWQLLQCHSPFSCLKPLDVPSGHTDIWLVKRITQQEMLLFIICNMAHLCVCMCVCVCRCKDIYQNVNGGLYLPVTNLLLSTFLYYPNYFGSEHVFKITVDMKRCSTLLIIREMQITAILRYHLTPVRMPIIKKSTNNKCLERVWRKGNPLILLVGM